VRHLIFLSFFPYGDRYSLEERNLTSTASLEDSSRMSLLFFQDLILNTDLTTFNFLAPTPRRKLSHILPRLGVLNSIPFSIPFDVRVSIFKHFVQNDHNRFNQPT
jgi:hypothetical protein